MTEIQETKIFNIQGTLFYLPNYPQDIISSVIVRSNNYWDYAVLKKIDNYLKDNSVILDIGANVGNHSLYWAKVRNAHKIYAFEPFKETFEILEKNVELNDLDGVIRTYNYGLSNESCTTDVTVFVPQNVGGTTFEKKSTGTYTFFPLDKMIIKHKIDFIKIDVEGHEIEVLEGAIDTISKNKPTIAIESFHNKNKVDSILLPLGYKLIEVFRENEDYLYQYVGENV